MTEEDVAIIREWMSMVPLNIQPPAVSDAIPNREILCAETRKIRLQGMGIGIN